MRDAPLIVSLSCVPPLCVPHPPAGSGECRGLAVTYAVLYVVVAGDGASTPRRALGELFQSLLRMPGHASGGLHLKTGSPRLTHATLDLPPRFLHGHAVNLRGAERSRRQRRRREKRHECACVDGRRARSARASLTPFGWTGFALAASWTASVWGFCRHRSRAPSSARPSRSPRAVPRVRTSPSECMTCWRVCDSS